MATTGIIPMHLNKGKSISRCLTDRTDYAAKLEKTDGGTLISSYACDPKTAASEFALSKREYLELTGRVQRREIIAKQQGKYRGRKPLANPPEFDAVVAQWQSNQITANEAMNRLHMSSSTFYRKARGQ